ncbi:LysR family transcriptional regulator [Cohnella lubricantis]|uniref:LysR family transcriptional regulator n=1 Tax=Cohnella lubricantis TaxID=2163172 RepID=A0A841T7X9_9BACL|nr:LysR family transcriptional regulator [Cohnella lubricantis]MBB6677022.1 LysR family transcriptional regulator [Cohnella lubricantis]MBP2119311.1 DNA-binding transcriptional LysR family regulator [Cohnella lubricantis]
MELRQLEYFIAVCEELHFSRAAEKLHISQPNLSLQIKALEEEVGTPLFDRIGKRIALTDAGRVLHKHSRNMLVDLKNAYDELSEIRRYQGGRLAVGVLPSELDYRLTPLFIDFHHQFPKVGLRIISSVDIVKLVLDTTIDIGLTLAPLPDERLTVHPLAREEYGLVVSAQHELASRESVQLSELKDLPMVIYPTGYWGRELVENACREHGFELHTLVETTSNPSLFRFVAENIGVTVQTAHLVQSVGDPRIRYIPIRDHAPYRQMSIVHRMDKYLSYPAQMFIRTVKERLSK